MLGQKRKLEGDSSFPPVKKPNITPASNAKEQAPVQESKAARKRRLKQERLAAQAEIEARTTSNIHTQTVATSSAHTLYSSGGGSANLHLVSNPLPHTQNGLPYPVQDQPTGLTSLSPAVSHKSVASSQLHNSASANAKKKSIGVAHDPQHPGSQGSFQNLGGTQPPPDPSRTLVMVLLPKKYRNPTFVITWASRFGQPPPQRVELDSKAGKALIEFSKAQFAKDAYASRRLSGGNGKEHIRVWWYQAPHQPAPARDPDEIEEGEIEEDFDGGMGTHDVDMLPANSYRDHAMTHYPSNVHREALFGDGHRPDEHFGMSVLPPMNWVSSSSSSYSRRPLAARFSSPSETAWNSYNGEMSHPPYARLEPQEYLPYDYWHDEPWHGSPAHWEANDATTYDRTPYVRSPIYVPSRSPSPVCNDRSKGAAPAPRSPTPQPELKTGRSPTPEDDHATRKQKHKKVVKRQGTPKASVSGHMPSAPPCTPSLSTLVARPESPLVEPERAEPTETPQPPPSAVTTADKSSSLPVNRLPLASSAPAVSTALASDSNGGLNKVNDAPANESSTRLALLARAKDLEERIARTREELARKAAERKNSMLLAAEALPTTEAISQSTGSTSVTDSARPAKDTVVVVSTNEVKSPNPVSSQDSSAQSSRASSAKPVISSVSVTQEENGVRTSVSVQMTGSSANHSASLDDLAVSFITESIQAAKSSPPPPPPSSSFKTTQSMEKLQLAAKQKRLEQHITLTKVLMAKLEAARTKDEKSKILAELRECRRLAICLLIFYVGS